MEKRIGTRVLTTLDAVWVAGLATLCVALVAPAASTQDWGSEADEDWSTPASPATAPVADTNLGWSIRLGVGFTLDPDTTLLNVEVPYVFDRWVSAGPMMQIGLDNDRLIVAPTGNVAVTIPDLPGELLDRLHPYGTAGMGFAVIEDDDRSGDNSSAGFLVNFGVGLEYQLSDHFYLDSHMMFNFLPEKTLDEKFFYSWQVAGMRIAF